MITANHAVDGVDWIKLLYVPFGLDIETYGRDSIT